MDDFIPLVSDDEEDFQEPQAVQSIPILAKVPIPCWVPDDPKYSSDMLTFLGEEIDDYLSFIRPTDTEHILRLLTIHRLEEAVTKEFPNAQVKCFGSFETRLYIPSSDLDVVVIDSTNNQHSPNLLRKLKRRLEKENLMSRMELIINAKVPIIKAVDKVTNFPIDICFNQQNGIQAAEIVKQVIMDPKHGEAIKSLMLILKQFLTQRHLNEVFTGGIGSYALLLMITSFIKLHPKIQTGEIDPQKNLAVLLIEFFELYGKYFNYEDVGIGFINGSEPLYFDKRRHGFFQESKPGALSIRDPQDPKNDVSRGSYAIRLVITEFQRAYRTLIGMIGASYEDGDLEQHISFGKDSRMITPLGSILAISRSVLEHREFVQKRYDEIMSTEGPDEHEEAPFIPKPPETQKRKRDDIEMEVEYRVADSDDEDEQTNHKKPRSDNLGIGVNDAYYRNTDGLEYSSEESTSPPVSETCLKNVSKKKKKRKKKKN